MSHMGGKSDHMTGIAFCDFGLSIAKDSEIQDWNHSSLVAHWRNLYCGGVLFLNDVLNADFVFFSSGPVRETLLEEKVSQAKSMGFDEVISVPKNS